MDDLRSKNHWRIEDLPSIMQTNHRHQRLNRLKTPIKTENAGAKREQNERCCSHHSISAVFREGIAQPIGYFSSFVLFILSVRI